MSSKSKLKEKILSWYDGLFELDKGLLNDHTNFWQEFFLLRPKSEYLSEKIKSVNTPQALQLLVDQCLEFSSTGSTIQVANALQTQSICMSALSQKFSQEHCFEYLDYLFGFDSTNEKVEKMAQIIINCAQRNNQNMIRNLALSLLLTAVSVRDSLEANPLSLRLLSSCLTNDISLLFEKISGDALGERLLASYVLLLSVRTNNNPCVQCLSCLDSALALDGIGAIVEANLRVKIEECLKEYTELSSQEDQNKNQSGWLSYMSSMFVAEVPRYKIGVADSSLLVLLITLKMNRNFTPVLTQWRARESEETPDAGAGSPPLATFLEYVSLLQQNIREPNKYNATMVAFSILTVIAEDQYANCFLHDDFVKFKLRLHRAPLRHRPVKVNDPASIQASTFAAWIFEICSEFIISHLMKCFPLQLHLAAIGIMHRLLIYQKRAKVRLQYNWRTIWETIIHLIKFVSSNVSSLIKQHGASEVHQLVAHALIVLNIFITFGDVLLLSTTSYDELYYELIRLKDTFAHLEKYIEKAIRDDVDNEGSRRCMALLFNIRAIEKHFEPILTAQNSCLSEKDILGLIQSNYDALNLRMLEGLDQFERFSCSLNKVTVDLVRSLVKESRENLLLLGPLDYKDLRTLN